MYMLYMQSITETFAFYTPKTFPLNGKQTDFLKWQRVIQVQSTNKAIECRRTRQLVKS